MKLILGRAGFSFNGCLVQVPLPTLEESGHAEVRARVTSTAAEVEAGRLRRREEGRARLAAEACPPPPPEYSLFFF